MAERATKGRERLTRERVLSAAVDLADSQGLAAVSMRRLAAELGVVPMAIYKHVADKDALVDGMLDRTLSEIEPTAPDDGWRASVRARVLAARVVQLRHPWLRRVLETQVTRTPSVLAHIEAMIGLFRAGGFSDPLTHHVMHAFGSRMWGFSQELFEDPERPAEPVDPQVAAQLAQIFPNIAAVALAASHDDGTVVSYGCDDQFEFEFALDLLLDGFARLHEQGWLPPGRPSVTLST